MSNSRTVDQIEDDIEAVEREALVREGVQFENFRAFHTALGHLGVYPADAPMFRVLASILESASYAEMVEFVKAEQQQLDRTLDDIMKMFPNTTAY